MSIDLIDTFPAQGRPTIDGLIKMKLVHAMGLSIMLPDLLLVHFNGEWNWLQPRFFSACQLSFEGERAYGQLSVDLDEQLQLFVGITKDRYVRRFRDGSQLFRCKIAGPADLEVHCTGRC